MRIAAWTVALLIAGAITVTTAPSASSNTGFKLPWTAGQTYTVTQTWGGGFSHVCPGVNCYAYDFGLPRGTEVRASAAGTVTLATGNDNVGGCSSTYAGRGNRVKIRHADNTVTVYLHLSDVTVTGNQQVVQGELIGHSGDTGYACGPHLHFQRDVARTSAEVYFDEYKGQQLLLNQRATSQNVPPDVTPTATPTATPAGTPGLDFDIAVPAARCASESVSTSCAVADEFTLEFRLNAIPPDFSYIGYEWEVQYTGIEIVPGSLDQMSAGTWPDCRSVTRMPEKPESVAACAVKGTASTYTGAMLRVDFRCPSPSSSGTITLVNSLYRTDLIDGSFGRHHEGADESIAIACPAAPTATPTSTPTATPTLTPTFTPTFTPTPTATPTPLPIYGDVSCDLQVNSIDASLLLQHAAGVVPELCSAIAADANGDGRVDVVDAALILQFIAGLIGALPPAPAPPPPTATPPPAPPVAGIAGGDVNCDGSVNAIDAALILQHAAGLAAVCDNLAADTNADGRLDAVDAALILQYAAGLIALRAQALPPT